MTKQPNTNNKKSLLLPVIGILASILLLLFAWWVARRPTPLPPIPPPTAVQPNLTEEQKKAFFDTEVRSALDAYESRNNEAVAHAADRISQDIEKYREGVRPFVKDITSWGTRFGVIRRVGTDLGEKWWGNSTNTTAVYSYASKKFEKHLFSDEKINASITRSLKQFHDDLEASKNKLHADVKVTWQKSGYAKNQLNLENLEIIVKQINASAQSVSAKRATDSVTFGVVSFVAGEALETASTALVKGIIARVATSIATSASVKGGGMAVTPVATTIGGRTGGIIGVAAGLIVGMIADSWMTDQLQEKLTSECNQMVTDVKGEVLIGKSESPGLIQLLTEASCLASIMQQDAIDVALGRLPPQNWESFHRRTCELMVKNIYQTLLGRAPDARQAAIYADQLTRRVVALQIIEGNLKKSLEYAEKTVPEIYRELLGREPDAEGMKTYCDLMIQGKMSDEDVRSAIRKSPEGVVRKLYLELLGRKPDTDGLKTFQNLIIQGKMSEQDVKTTIMKTSEYAQRTVRKLYRELLEREPDTDGLKTFQNLIAQGKMSEEDVRKAIMKTSEYAQRTVRKLYRELLRREPDADGMETFHDPLIQGKMSEDDVRMAIMNSSEYLKRGVK